MDSMTNMQQLRRGLSGSTLKLIAVISMFIDHTGAAILGRMLLTRTYINTQAYTVWVTNYSALHSIYRLMRDIGRIAFPIYCFLLVEGFLRTRDAKKYAMRLGAFALVSEVPFDLAFKARVLEGRYQNVFFTLFLGLLTMMAVDWVYRNVWDENRTLRRIVCPMIAAAAVLVGCLAAHFLHTDYGAKGIMCIMVLYLTRRWKPVQLLAGAIAFLWEVPAPVAFVPVAIYNGKRGLRLKYLFYAFYPAHLLLLYLVSFFLGFSEIAVFG